VHLSALNLLGTLILAAITAWYAYSTAKILREMRRQADAVREQSLLVSKSAQVVAWAALTTLKAHPAGEKPYERLRELIRQLEEADTILGDRE
jgi:hypothetical protein